MAKTITVFTRTDCPYCQLLKRFLDMKKADYKTINMDEDGDALAKVMEMTGRTIAPTTIIEKEDGTQEVIVGYNLSRVVPELS